MPVVVHVLFVALALCVLGNAGCPQRVERQGQQEQPAHLTGEMPSAVTLAYVGGYRGFHRPCG